MKGINCNQLPTTPVASDRSYLVKTPQHASSPILAPKNTPMPWPKTTAIHAG